MKNSTEKGNSNFQFLQLKLRYAKLLQLVALSVAFLLFIAATLQDENIDKFVRLFHKHKTLFPHEKVYLHTDRPYYMVGDTIWFAAYINNAVTHQPSTISNILHVDFINSSAQVVIRQKWHVDSGYTRGQIAVEDTLMQDAYTIRAYTAWMCNFDSTLFFTKQVNVFQLFPEGFRCDATLTSNGENQALNLKMVYNGSNPAVVKNCPVRYRIKASKFSVRGEGVIDSTGHLYISQVINGGGIANPTIELQYTDTRKKKQRTEVEIKLPHEPQISVRFFPESGQMVEELPARMAFEVRDERGAPLALQGVLIGNNEKLLEVESNFAGYGAFFLNPLKSVRYAMTLTYGGSEHTFLLPVPQEQGVTMLCDNSGDSELRIKVFGKLDDKEQGKEMLLVGHVRGELMFVSPISLNGKGIAQVKISTTSYPQGILHITLVNGKGVPCAERLVYVDNGERINVWMATRTMQRDGRDMTVVAITAKDQEGNPASARFSLSVVDESLVILPDSTEENICSYMLLSSDLQGRIYAPGYYFSRAPKAKMDLDLLLLTQGWCRFDPDLCKTDSLYPVRYPVEKKLTIAGKMNNINQKKAKDYSVTLLSYAADNRMYEMLHRNVRDDGSFSFVFDNFCGSLTAKIFTRNHNRRLRDIDVSIVQAPNPPAAPLNHVPDLNAIAQADQKILDHRVYLENSMEKTIMLEGVAVASRAKEVNDIQYHSGGERPDVILVEKDVAKHNTVMQAILISAPEFHVRHDMYGGAYLQAGGGKSHVRSRNIRLIDTETGELAGVESGGVGIVINGQPGDVVELQSLTPSEVGSIRIYRRLMSGAALVAVTTKPGAKYVQGSIIVQLKGFDRAKRFYVPLTSPWELQAKLRPTIYWRANIKTDSLGRAVVGWPKSNKVTTVRLRVEGMTQQGVPMAGERTYRNLPK